MQIATTASTGASGDDPIVFRGPFEKTIPQMAKLGYEAVELHIMIQTRYDRDACIQIVRRKSCDPDFNWNWLRL